MHHIQINGNSRPDAGAASTAFLNTFAAPPPSVANSNYILIQTKGPLSAQQKQELRDKDVEILEYKGEDVYLCGYKPTTLEPLISNLRDFVTDAEVYHPDYVVERDLKTGNDDDEAEVEVALHDNIGDDGMSRVVNDIAAQADIPVANVELHDRKACIKVPKSKLAQLARIDEVKAINEVQTRRLFNNVACGILEAHTPVGTAKTTYKGKGQVVCVADTGFDTGSLTEYHEAFGDRVISLHARGRPAARGEPGNSDDPDGHGTHVCGSVLGKGGHAKEGEIEAPASEAKLVMQSLFDKFDKSEGPDPKSWNAGLGGIGNSYPDLFGGVFREGATIHTNSWGGPPQPYVERESAKIDSYLWGNKDMTVLFAAGNSGADIDRNPGHVDPHSLSAQAVSKNVITVGASENRRPNVKSPVAGNKPLVYGAWRSKFPFGPISVDNVADNPEGMAAFSSRGPTRPDGRIKPDVVAPGTTILSARSSKIEPGHHGESWGRSSDARWMYLGGTSMATPLVAGCCAVIRGALVDNRVPRPSAALIKALLINGAVPMKGQYNQALPNGEFGPSVDAPNPNSGFGRVNLANSLRNIVANQESTVYGYQDVTGDQSLGMDGQHRGEHAVTVDIPEGSPAGLTLKVTLVWTDFPGERLQNDLDLIVAGAGIEKHGNQGDGSGFDRVNNVEQVVWKNVKPGSYTVTVRAFLTTKDPQPFALAWRAFA
ncbi:Serine protease/ABC transporter B family protein tagC [Metarhizium anisopliae]|nr:Serine protease/ABC transporter B family protein tagC [Metarhizium anisopliae]